MAMPTIRSAYSAVSWPDSWRQSRLRNESMFTAPYVDRRGLTRNWEEFSALSGRAQDVVGLNARRRMAGRLHNPKLGLQPWRLWEYGWTVSACVGDDRDCPTRSRAALIRGVGKCWDRHGLRDGPGCSWRPSRRRRGWRQQPKKSAGRSG